tara:strand:+ start:5576 stop:6406 length:831 start_codon:yes stop_codon:yes gene_type:complete
MEVVGFSSAGCKIAKEFEKYPQYNVHYVDVDIGGENCYSLPKVETMQDAEKHAPSVSSLAEAIQDKKTFFICAGGGITSGFTLRILEQIKKAQLYIIYVRPDLTFLNDDEARREKIVYRIFQEFARSGLFEKMFVFDNAKISDIIGELSIVEYFAKINEMIASSLHMFNYLSNTKSIISNIQEAKEANRISTLAIYDLNEEKERCFFDLKNIREKHFYFAFKEDTLQKEKNMFKKIREQVKKAGQPELTSVSYDITSTTYENNFAYVASYTNFIQD